MATHDKVKVVKTRNEDLSDYRDANICIFIERRYPAMKDKDKELMTILKLALYCLLLCLVRLLLT